MTSPLFLPPKSPSPQAARPASPRLLALLEGECAPALRGRKALLRGWDKPAYQILGGAPVLPSWKWTNPYTRPEATRITTDVNGAWLAAASCVNVAWGGLVHAGAQTEYRRRPGYYYTQIPEGSWADLRMPHPLGTSRYDAGMVWLPEPVMTLLQDLNRRGDWPDIRIYDAWLPQDTADGQEGPSVRLSTWVSEVQRQRLALIAGGDETRAQLADFKVAYAQAVEMMHGPLDDQGKPKCYLRRPDWQHAIKAMHAANTWRKAYACALAGHAPAAVGGVDALDFTAEDLIAIQQLTTGERRGPLRIDQSGRSLGALKITGKVNE